MPLVRLQLPMSIRQRHSVLFAYKELNGSTPAKWRFEALFNALQTDARVLQRHSHIQ
jgi:hypothetical protein